MKNVTNFSLNIYKNKNQTNPLNDVLDNMGKVNDYDYKNMIEEFELKEVKDKKKKDRVYLYYNIYPF